MQWSKAQLVLGCVAGFMSAAAAAQEAPSATAQTPPRATTSAAQRASQVGNLKLGFVNFRRIMGTIPQLNEIKQQLDGEFAEQRAKLVAAQKSLQDMETQATQISGDQNYDTLESQLIAKRREVSRMDSSLRDNYSVRRNEELAKLQRLVLDQILAISKEQGYDVILNDTGVIYVSPRADLTALVIERMNSLADAHRTNQASGDANSASNQ